MPLWASLNHLKGHADSMRCNFINFHRIAVHDVIGRIRIEHLYIGQNLIFPVESAQLQTLLPQF